MNIGVVVEELRITELRKILLEHNTNTAIPLVKEEFSISYECATDLVHSLGLKYPKSILGKSVSDQDLTI